MTSTNDEPTTAIIKSDTAGRIRYSREYREEALAGYAESGMSGPAFARHCGIKYPTFASWVAAKKRAGTLPAGGGGQKFLLAELDPCPAPGGGALRIALPGGAAASIDDASGVPLLAALIRELA